ncbi:hypothetical protein L1987_58176 [Smallanthus sonchifolius]|uniref:Uncharacterized protein n=1 Tax=Smallanthus sonchifolius TaxID=185202 RepID=A0ACB9DF77_9ASTR|nr:hypothetical protein L1987_58176 [Smallanthus sonchifolius]
MDGDFFLLPGPSRHTSLIVRCYIFICPLDQQTKLQQMAGKNTLTALGENMITIAELLKKQQGLAGKTFICTASITEITRGKNWCYNACPNCLQTIL